jgi:ribosomal protein S18 acetylase RimI-like enzyme
MTDAAARGPNNGQRSRAPRQVPGHAKGETGRRTGRRGAEHHNLTSGQRTPPLLRRATRKDAGAIKALVSDAYAIYLSRIGRWPEPATADYRRVVTTAETWVAVEAATIIGVLAFRPTAAVVLIENVAVAPSHQGRGIGSALLRLAERRARESGASVLELYTNEAMTENLTLYRRLGYTEVGRRTEHGFRRVYLQLALSAPTIGQREASHRGAPRGTNRS